MASRAATPYASEKLGWLNGKIASASIVMLVLIASCAMWIVSIERVPKAWAASSVRVAGAA